MGSGGSGGLGSTLCLLTAFGGLESFGVSVFINSLCDSCQRILAGLARGGADDCLAFLIYTNNRHRARVFGSEKCRWARLVEASAGIVGRHCLRAAWLVLFRAASRSSTASRA